MQRKIDRLQSKMKPSYPTKAAMEAACDALDDAHVELYKTQKTRGFGQFNHNPDYVPVVSPNRKRRVLLLEPIMGQEKHFGGGDYMQPNPRVGTLRLSATQVRTLLIPMISIACCQGRRHVLDVLQECVDADPSSVQPHFDDIFAAMMEHKMDGLTSNAHQTIDGYFAILSTLWPLAPESSRAACFNALLANMASNEAHINEQYPNRDDMPHGREADPTCHVMRRWSRSVWHRNFFSREPDLMDESNLAVVAGILDSMPKLDREASTILEVLGKVRDKALPYVHIIATFHDADQGGFPLMVLANIASPPESSDPPFDKPGLIVGTVSVVKGMRLCSTDVNAMVGREPPRNKRLHHQQVY
jgi:hypothetical protein